MGRRPYTRRVDTVTDRISFTKGSKDWLEFRSKNITGTELPTLFGLNQYSNPSKVYENKIHPTFIDNEFTRMGQILEPAVAKLTEHVLQIPVHQFSNGRADMVIFNKDLRLSATPDAFTGTEDYVQELVELKSTSIEKLNKWDDSPPLHYLLQLATQLYLADLEYGYLTIMVPRYPDLPSIIYKFRLDADLFVKLVKPEIDRFWDTFEVRKKLRFPINKKAAGELVDMLLINTTKIHTDIKPLPTLEFNWGDTW